MKLSYKDIEDNTFLSALIKGANEQIEEDKKCEICGQIHEEYLCESCHHKDIDHEEDDKGQCLICDCEGLL